MSSNSCVHWLIKYKHVLWTTTKLSLNYYYQHSHLKQWTTSLFGYVFIEHVYKTLFHTYLNILQMILFHKLVSIKPQQQQPQQQQQQQHVSIESSTNCKVLQTLVQADMMLLSKCEKKFFFSETKST